MKWFQAGLRWFRVGLEIFGAVSLICIALFLLRPSSDRLNSASRKDVLSVLKWAEIPTNQDFKILGSYQSSRSFTEDYFDYYCIELSRFDIPDHGEVHLWNDGPERNQLLIEALDTGVNEARSLGNCFPSTGEANSGAFKMMFSHVLIDGHHPSSAEIFLYDPKKQTLYYVGYKT
ncbi:MAG TPA: hypothetical protein VK776_15135 [Bryobacteraceae bacterium]|jgi:hypothetical protein|nr:hypothetical protein [Bryobacteraceae bacterium]